VRLVIARCSVDYIGRLTAHLPMANRLLLVKADGSVSVHADDRAYKPLNWMTPPCTFKEELTDGAGTWTITNKAGEQLLITIDAVEHDSSHDLGVDPGLQKDGVEAELQRLLALHVETFGPGWSLVRREYPTAIGPVDLLCRDASGTTVAVEVKRRGEIDGANGTLPAAKHVAVEVKRRATIEAVEQVCRYVEYLNRDPLLAPVRGLLAAQEVTPQARTLAADRGIEVRIVDYDELAGRADPSMRLF
jgi:endonuclease